MPLSRTTRKLPSGYTDTTDYLNLAGIKGLQIVDNPLAAEQNSTYDCENVYTDDFGNLTVRPALRQINKYDANLKLIVRTSRGEFLILQAPHTVIYLDSVLVFEGYLTHSCEIFEYDSNIYLVTNEYGLHLFKFDETKFVTCDGTIPITSSNTISIDDYNILNNKLNVVNLSLKNALDIDPIPLNLFVPSNYKYTAGRELYWADLESDALNRLILANGQFILKTTESEIFKYSEYNNKLVYPILDSSNNLYTFFGINDGYMDIREYSSDHDYASYTYMYFKYYTDFEQNVGFTYPINLIDITQIGFGSINNEVRVIVCGSVIAKAVVLSEDLGNSNEMITISGEMSKDRVYYSNNYIFVTNRSTIKMYNLQGNEVYRLAVTQEVTHIDVVDKYIVANFGGYTIISNYENGWAQRIQDTGKVVTVSGVPVIVTQDSMIVISNDNIKYCNSKFVLPNIIGMSDNKPTTVDIGGELVYLNNLTRYYDRDISVIPTAGRIDEKLISTLYLDNSQWIITEHTIIGTGVDNNTGFPTAEYWDPSKYFKVSETITGVARVSDASFWVFHSDGAYLIYKTSQTIGTTTSLVWGITKTPKSKGCDFTNALTTLPVSNYIASVTANDISVVQLRENVQSDDRSLVPITMAIRGLISELLAQTESVVIGTFKYLSLFALNSVSKNETTVIVYDNATNNWWLWNFPVDAILQFMRNIDTDETELLCEKDGQKIRCILTLDLYQYSPFINATATPTKYEIYADLFLDADNHLQPTQIKWSWESAMLVFKSLNYRKQLMQTIFTVDDSNTTEPTDTTTMNFKYKFKVYHRGYSAQDSRESEITLTRAQNLTVNTRLAAFTFLQLELSNNATTVLTDNLEYMTKPKIASLTFKYKTLTGGLS